MPLGESSQLLSPELGESDKIAASESQQLGDAERNSLSDSSVTDSTSHFSEMT